MKKYIFLVLFALPFVLSSCGMTQSYSYYDDCMYTRPDKMNNSYLNSHDIYNDLIVETGRLYNDQEAQKGLTPEQRVIFEQLSSGDSTAKADSVQIYNIELFQENDPYLGYSSMYYGPWQPWFYGWGYGYSYNWGFNNPWYWDPWYRYSMTGFAIDWMYGSFYYPGAPGWFWDPWYYPAFYPGYYPGYYPGCYPGYYPYPYPCYSPGYAYNKESIYGRRDPSNSSIAHLNRQNSISSGHSRINALKSGASRAETISRKDIASRTQSQGRLKQIRGSRDYQATATNINYALKSSNYNSRITNDYIRSMNSRHSASGTYRLSNTYMQNAQHGHYMDTHRRSDYRNNNFENLNTRYNANTTATFNPNRTNSMNNSTQIRQNTGYSGSTSRATVRTNRSRR